MTSGIENQYKDYANSTQKETSIQDAISRQKGDPNGFLGALGGLQSGMTAAVGANPTVTLPQLYKRCAELTRMATTALDGQKAINEAMIGPEPAMGATSDNANSPKTLLTELNTRILQTMALIEEILRQQRRYKVAVLGQDDNALQSAKQLAGAQIVQTDNYKQF